MNKTLKKPWPILQIMKISVIQIFLSVMLSGFTYGYSAIAQEFLNNPVSVRSENTKLRNILVMIEKQTGVGFVYSSKAISADRRVSVDLKQKKLSEALHLILEPLKISYRIVEGQIILYPRNTAEESSIPDPDNSGSSYSVTDYLVTEIQVSGKVLDEKGEGLPGVSVLIKDTQRGTVTNSDGEFLIDVPDVNSVLVFSFVGYKSQEVRIGNQNFLEINLLVDDKALEEVVVVGYGKLQKKDLTGSITAVNQEAVKDLPVATLDQKMIGQVAGVQIQQVSGLPGAGTSVRIRGSGSLGAGNEPLYVVDGMPYSAGLNQNLNPLMLINPNDIESITVLKDASSTAIYGSRGANGVVMITTKRGQYNKTQVAFSAMRGVQSVPQKGRPNLMNQQEFVDLQRNKIEIAVRRAENREATLEDYPEEYRYPERLVGDGTDWYDVILRDAPIEDYNISIQKGGTDSRMDFGVGYFRQAGVVQYTGIERYSAKLGAETVIGSHVTIGANLQPTFIQQKRANTNSDRGDIIGVAHWANPLLSPYDSNGELIPYLVSPQSRYHSAWNFANPLFILRETTQMEKQFQSLGNAHLTWNILPGLEWRTALNTQWSTSNYFQYTPSTVGGANVPPVAGTGRSSNNRSEHFNWLIENTLSFNRIFGKHKIDAVAGYTTQKSTTRGINLNAAPYPNDLIQTINAAQTINSWGENVNTWSMISYLGRINYNFDNKYLLTGTLRSDGSSRFGANNRFALFPSVAGAWRISEESFMKGLSNHLNELKIRASFGVSGNNNIGNYSHLASINAGAYLFGNNQVNASYVGLANPNLTWEESKQVDVGIDAELLEGRLSATIDLYHRESSNMLLNDVIPAITGFNSQIVNKGKVRNRGIEISLGGRPLSGALKWDINANIAFNRNMVMSINENNDRILSGNNDNNPTHVTIAGKPIGQFFGFELLGVYTAEDMANPDIIKTTQVYEGNPKYRDIDGDGIINDLLDYTIIGNPHPNFTFGITNNFSYKGFTLGIIMNGQQGGQVMNGLRQTVDNLQGFFNVRKEWVNRWRSTENPGTGYLYGVPKLTPSWGHRVNTLWVEDASFLRISNVTLGYSLPGSLFSNSNFISSCRLFLTVQNLAVFTHYEGANPEAQSRNFNNTLAPGFDMTGYPLNRTVSMGINLSF